MWLYLCCYIFCSALISGEVITLINENEITCVLTEGSVNSTLDVNPEGGLNNVRRRVEEITNWKKSDWILKNSTHFNFGPVLDQRWTDFTGIGNEDTDLSDRETFSVCTKNEWNITVAASGDRKNVTIPRHDITWSLNIKFVFFKIDLLALQKSSCSWRHYTPRKTGYGVILTSVRNEIINTSLKFDALWINFPNDKNYKLHRYEFLFANTTSTEVSYIVVNFTHCVTFYVSVDTGCYLNISLSSERSSKSIRVDGFNEQNTFRKWKKYEMRNEIDVSGILSFFRGRNDSSTIGFWAIDDIHSCDSEIVVYEANLANKTWKNETCEILNFNEYSNKTCNSSSFGKQCQIKCSTILGPSSDVKTGHNTINNGTTLELNDISYLEKCTFRLFSTIKEHLQLIDQTTINLRNLTKEIEDVEFPKNVTLTKKHILIELNECIKFSASLNYSLKVTCISRWCTNESTEIVAFDLKTYSATFLIDAKNLYAFTDYNITIEAKRFGQKTRYRVYSYRSTPLMKPHSVKDLFLYSVNRRLFIKWKEPYPPTGRIESYNVTLRYIPNTTTNSTNFTFPCEIWGGFICANIILAENFTAVNITVQAKNYDVSEWSEVTSVFVPQENVIFAPGHLQVQLSQPNEMIISWKHPVYTNGKIKAFEIVVDDGEEETRFTEEISSENLSYNKTIRIEYEKRYNISVWGQNVDTRGRKATIYAIFSKSVPEFSTIPFLTTCGRTCSLILPTAKSQKIKKLTVIITKNNKDQVFCSENVTFCDTGLQMQDIWKQKYYLKIDNATFPIEFTAVDVDIKKTELFYVVIALCAVLMIIIGFPSYLVFKRRKQIFRKHSNTNSENTAMLEFEEKKNSTENDNSLCRETKLSDFKNYFLASLDDNKIIQQFKVISKFRDRSCTRELENFDFENYLPHNETTAMNNERRHLNANYINSYDMPKAFLVTEPPLESTLHDFWFVVCQENIKTIIMLTKLEENGSLKCEKYWPDEHSHFRFGKFLIRSVSVKVKSDYVQQILEVKYDNETRVVRHFQYLTWSNRNVPQSVTNFTSFVTELMEDRDQYPFVVHCDGKRGRTGIYILCEVALRMSIQEGKVDFLKTCKEINQPAGLISHLEQYIFCHFVMLEYHFGEDFGASDGRTYFMLKIQDAMQESSLQRLVDDLEMVTKQYHTTVKKSYFRNLLDSRSNFDPITVDSFNYPKRFVVTKQPSLNSVEYFWNLVMSYEVEMIVSLNQKDDKGKDCPRFWPTDPRQTWSLGESCKLTFLSEDNHTDVFDIFTMKIHNTSNNDEKIVKIINVKTWDGTSVRPLNIKDLIYVWDKTVLYNGQIIVTCYDGKTASGLFVALAYLLEKINTDHCCNVFNVARNVKQSCPHFLKNPEQIKFLYEAALEYVREFTLYEIVV